MACCIALTLLFSWGYRVWRVIARPQAELSFAPPARWPVGGADAAVDPGPARVREADKPSRQIARACVVLGLAWFVSGIVAMHVLHLAEISPGAADLAFHASGLWLAAGGAVALTVRRPSAREVLA